MYVCMYLYVDVQRALDEEVKLLRSGFTDKYLKDLKEKERQMELLLRKAEELAAYPPQTRYSMLLNLTCLLYN